MKKFVFSMACLCALTTIAYADGNAFTPLNFNDTTYNTSTTKAVATKATKTATTATKATTSVDDAIGNVGIQNAISQLESAQVDIRNDLLNCKSKYSEVDAQYKLVKAERKAAKAAVKTTEKRIKEIDKAKEKIRKSML